MSDHAFSKISSMAGPKVPARHQTLNAFLKLTTTIPFDRAAVVRAVESNCEILRHCLTFITLSGAPITRWHEQMTDQAFSDLALKLANSTQSQSPAEPHDGWQRSRLAHLIATGLGQALVFEKERCHRFELLAEMLAFGDQLADAGSQSNEELGANWLADRGASNVDCDVLRYQKESLEVLREASDDLILMSLTGRIADAMLNSFELPDEYFELLHDRFGLSEETVHHLFENAYVSLRAENDKVLARDDFDRRLGLANLAQQFVACRDDSAILDLAAECFGVSNLLIAKIQESSLLVDYDCEQIRISMNTGSSVISQAYQTQTAFSAEGNALAAIVDKQLLSRMAADVLWLVPFANGVAICAVKQAIANPDPFLLDAFSRACEQLSIEEADAEQTMIGLDEVQTRVRELTHEVNNPLAIVQNYLKTLSLRLGSDSSAQTDIKTISDEMLRIGTIIQKYAEIGQEPSGDITLTNINQVIADLAGVVSGGHPQIEFETELDKALPGLEIRAAEFKQVLLNLMKNAAEALAGQQNAKLALRTRGQVNLNGFHFVEVVVEDNGPGIDKNIYQELFLANNSSKGEGHSGIGLSVAHKLIMEMGGYISCRSDETGTQFQILLPTNELEL